MIEVLIGAAILLGLAWFVVALLVFHGWVNGEGFYWYTIPASLPVLLGLLAIVCGICFAIGWVALHPDGKP